MNQPIARFKCGSCEAAIFENEIKRNGNTVMVKKTAIQKRYKADDDTWKSTYSLDINDIPKMILALTKAYEHLVVREESKIDLMTEELITDE